MGLNEEQSAKYNFWKRYETLNKKDKMEQLGKMASNIISAVFFKGDFKQRTRRVREELVERLDGLIEAKNYEATLKDDN